MKETFLNKYAATFTYPSHPPLPEGIDPGIEIARDPKGWSYYATMQSGCAGNEISSLFPDLGLWDCTVVPIPCVAGGPQALTVALLMTATSTTTEADLSSLSKVEYSSPAPVAATATALREQHNAMVPPVIPPLTDSPSSTLLRPADDKPSTPGQEATLIAEHNDELPTTVRDTPDAVGQSIVGPQTLMQGNEVTVSGTTISIASDEAYAAVGIKTQSFAIAALPALTIGSQTITADSADQYIVGSQTLTPGGVITVSSTTVSLASNRAYAVVGLKTQSLGITAPPALKIGSQTITANSADDFIVGSQTLTPGGVVVVSGTTISLASGGTEAVVGTSTVGLGPYIIAGLGGNGTANASTGLAFTGAAEQSQKRVWCSGILMIMGLVAVVWL